LGMTNKQKKRYRDFALNLAERHRTGNLARIDNVNVLMGNVVERLNREGLTGNRELRDVTRRILSISDFEYI
jgi:hypothetical protein